MSNSVKLVRILIQFSIVAGVVYVAYRYKQKNCFEISNLFRKKNVAFEDLFQLKVNNEGIPIDIELKEGIFEKILKKKKWIIALFKPLKMIRKRDQKDQLIKELMTKESNNAKFELDLEDFLNLIE